MINMKLKIGNVAKKEKETTDAKLTDYIGKLTDEECQEMQEEVKALDVDEEDEKEMEEAINGANIYDEVGINSKTVLKFNELFPNKKTVYRDLITKQFLEWYINNAKETWLDKLNLESEHINKNQQKDIAKMIKNRLAESKLVDVETEDKFKLETDEEIDMYNFLLNEQWDKKNTMRILELNGLISEQMETKGHSVHRALKVLIDTFGLKFEKKGAVERELDEEHSLLDIPKKKEKKEKLYIRPKEISKSIGYFHHIKFLYKLMGDKMDFNKTPTEKETEQIEVIYNLLFGHINEQEKENDNGHQSIGQMKVDDGIEGFNV